MKTQIIQLEAHDDAISTRDKMGWSQTSRILLVFPEKGGILNQLLDLVLLKRHSSALGCQLAFVTDDTEVKHYARQLGIPVYPNTRQAQAALWRIPAQRRLRPLPSPAERPNLAALKEQITRPPARWANNRVVNWAAFACSLAAILALVVVLLPGATIQLTPRLHLQELTLPVSTSEEITTLSLAGGLPSRAVTIVVEGRGVITATGKVNVPVSPATGNVQFTNLTNEAVTLPSGTPVSTLGSEPIWFSTTREGKVPAGIGKSAVLPVQAVEPGAQGNLPARSIRAVGGAQGYKLSVSNLAPTRNGADQPVPAPTPEDQNRLYSQLFASLSQTARQEFQARYSGEMIESGFPLISSMKLSKVLEQTTSPAVNEPGEALQMNLRIEFTALEISSQDLQNLVTPLLNASLPEGYVIVPSTLTILNLDEPKVDAQGKVQWTLYAQRQARAVIDPQEAVRIARGLPLRDALQRLQKQLPLNLAPAIQIFPSWWRYLPFFALRIQVQVAQ